MKYSSLIFLIIICGCYGRKPKMVTGLEGQRLPIITLLAADSNTLYTTANVIPQKPTILFSFETWCPYCRAETTEFLAHIKEFKDVNIFMACYTPLHEFRKFSNYYHLDKYSNIKAGIDFKFSSMQYFHTKAIPLIAVYDRNQRLKQVFSSKTDISTILSVALK